MTPLVSVIIPTAGRPHFLPRAVESALCGFGRGEIEVIVVPNGPDRSWKESLARLERADEVTVLPIETANGNAARNHGLKAARGKYVRFLDDDDFLYPDTGRTQYELLEQSGADLCRADVDHVDADAQFIARWVQPDSDDLVEAALSLRLCCQPVMYLFRRQVLDGLRWRESLRFAQDICWMLDLCAAKELASVRMQGPAGVFRHHWQERVSSRASMHTKHVTLAALIQETVARLEASGRMSPQRHHAAGNGLWHCFHMAFYRNPMYWFRFAATVLSSYPDSRPNIGLYRYRAGRWISPILVDLVMIPKRWWNDGVRAVARKLQLRPPVM